MDFFEAQARAKKRTARLVVLFVLAIFAVVAAGYFSTVVFLRNAPVIRQARPVEYDAYAEASQPPQAWWDPRVLTGVTLATLVVVGLASLYKWNELRAGGRAVAEMMGGTRIDPRTTDLKERQLLNVVEEMSIASSVPLPAVYVLADEAGINAFAAGLTTSDAVVAVTRGTLEKLNRDELQGVIAHEFSHILNGDMRLNLKLTALLFGILVIGLIGRGIIYNLRFARVRSDNNKNGGGLILAFLAAGILLTLLGYAGYFFGRLIQAAVSRQREFLADASSVQFTRNPGGITGALKKIGGYALGSSLQSTKSAQIGHFFFAQGFRANFGGLWATHPSLEERIRAVDASFDGKYFEPPQTVDVTTTSWPQVQKNTAPARLPSPALAAALSAGFAPVAAPSAHTLVASIGTLTPAAVADAQTLLNAIPAVLREAARTPESASALLCGLLLDPDPAQRASQLALISRHGGPELAAGTVQLEVPLLSLRSEARLPLVLLALPALQILPPASLERLLVTLDELVNADGRISTFEFALNKVLSHHLALGQKPSAPGAQIYSFEALSSEFAVVLSALALAASDDDRGAAQAFAAGANQLKMFEGRLALLPATACGFTQLDAALDHLAAASLPIKRRLLVAGAQVITADGTIRVSEIELLRAFASALDCPMPALTA